MAVAAMQETTAVAVNPFAVMDMAAAVARKAAVKKYVSELMTQGIDFGVIPGTNDKPVLLKPGAEKLCSFFGLRTKFIAVEVMQDWERGRFAYWFKCQLFYQGELVAEADGACNSLEKKYRWMSRYENTITEEERGRVAKKETRRSRDGKPYTVYQLENDDPYSLVNTLIKMAQKRALIAATLIATNASDLFSYKHEDEDLEGDDGAVPTGAKAAPASEAKGASLVRGLVSEVKVATGGSGNKTWKRFDIIIGGIKYSAFDTHDGEAAQRAVTEKRPCELSYTADAKGYKTVVKNSLRLLEAGAETAAATEADTADRIMIVCSTRAPEGWRKELAAAGFTCGPDGLTWTAKETEVASACGLAASAEGWCKEVRNEAGGAK